MTLVSYSDYGCPYEKKFSQKRHYRRPVCEPSQSCSYGFQQFTFELCDCPDAKPCPMDNGVQLKGITYQFCGARELPMCASDEIAAEIDVLQTSIYCVCPLNQIYVKQKETVNANVKYVCQEKEVCEAGQMCGVGNPIVGIKRLCQCAANTQCQVTAPNVFNPLLIQNATCQPM
uniref:EB domain-containing protein n=2 Tax=Caenorhabditis tropicalis TaxID=1561998 RepID=A0A1I7U7K5_9PELO